MHSSLYDKRYRCLFCGQEFTNKKPRASSIRQIRRDPDFCGHYQGENPYFYEVAVCPPLRLCLYSRFHPCKEGEQGKDRKRVYKKIRHKDYTGVRTLEDALKVFKLALLCGNLNQERKGILARLCL